MAGKEIYIGRMLAALETSMNNVSNGMAETVSILEQLLNNQGLERKQAAYTGQSLVALNPTFVNGDVIELGPECTIDADLNLNFYKIQQQGTPTQIASTTILHVKGKDLKNWKFPLRLTMTTSTPGENLTVRDMWVRNMLPFDPYGNGGLCVFKFPNGNVAQHITYYSLPTSQSGSASEPLYADDKYNIADNEELLIYFGNAWDVTSQSITSIYSLVDADGKSLLSTGQLVVEDYVYSVEGRGGIIFSFDLSGTAGELSDAKIIADLNENDSVDLLTAAGEVYQENAGLVIPLAELPALAFKLRFHMSTGSTLSGINVRYY